MRQHDEIVLGQIGKVGAFPIKQATIDAATAATHTIVTAVERKKIRVIGIMLQPLPSNVSLQWKSNTTALAPAATWLAGSGWSDYWGPHGWFFETAAGEALNLTLGGAVQVGGWLNYIEVPG
jgi:hypothetical protein